MSVPEEIQLRTPVAIYGERGSSEEQQNQDVVLSYNPESPYEIKMTFVGAVWVTDLRLLQDGMRSGTPAQPAGEGDIQVWRSGSRCCVRLRPGTVSVIAAWNAEVVDAWLRTAVLPKWQPPRPLTDSEIHRWMDSAGDGKAS